MIEVAFFIVGTLFLLGIIVFVIAAIAQGNGWLLVGMPFCCIALAMTVASCNETDSHKARIAADDAQYRLDQVPRLISEADGCKVYSFKGGDRWQYFTRCPNAGTSTDTSVTVRTGKTSHVETTTITTP